MFCCFIFSKYFKFIATKALRLKVHKQSLLLNMLYDALCLSAFAAPFLYSEITPVFLIEFNLELFYFLYTEKVNRNSIILAVF